MDSQQLQEFLDDFVADQFEATQQFIDWLMGDAAWLV